MTREQIANHYPPIRRASLPARNTTVGNGDDDDEYEDVWPPPMPRSAIRYQGVTTGQSPVIYSGKRKYVLHEAPPQQTPPPQKAQQARPKRIHWLVPVGLVMLTMIAGFIVVSFLINWWSTSQDDLRYGRPRTYQTDMVVGHADSQAQPSHFIALNYNRKVEAIEFPGGDASKAKVYLVSTLIGDGQDLTVVTLTFKDVTGNGKLDMIVNIGNSHFVFVNDQGQFRPARPGEPISL